MTTSTPSSTCGLSSRTTGFKSSSSPPTSTTMMPISALSSAVSFTTMNTTTVTKPSEPPPTSSPCSTLLGSPLSKTPSSGSAAGVPPWPSTSCPPSLACGGHLPDLLHALPTPDLSNLSPHQLHLIDRLQTTTIKEEKHISEELAKNQETLADPTMVELAHAVTQMMNGVDLATQIDDPIDTKEAGFVGVLQMADDLPLQTLKQVVEILAPMQSAHFLIAAAKLHLRVHEWGKKRDACEQEEPGCMEEEPGHSKKNGAASVKNGTSAVAMKNEVASVKNEKWIQPI